MDGRQLPHGWTLQRIRDGSGDPRADVLGVDRAVAFCGVGGAPDEVLHPVLVLGFGVLCIVQAANDALWYMGSINDDGSIICWSAYDELYDALRGL